jgi:hypothetical protein
MRFLLSRAVLVFWVAGSAHADRYDLAVPGTRQNCNAPSPFAMEAEPTFQSHVDKWVKELSGLRVGDSLRDRFAFQLQKIQPLSARDQPAVFLAVQQALKANHRTFPIPAGELLSTKYSQSQLTRHELLMREVAEALDCPFNSERSVSLMAYLEGLRGSARSLEGFERPFIEMASLLALSDFPQRQLWRDSIIQANGLVATEGKLDYWEDYLERMQSKKLDAGNKSQVGSESRLRMDGIGRGRIAGGLKSHDASRIGLGRSLRTEDLFKQLLELARSVGKKLAGNSAEALSDSDVGFLAIVDSPQSVSSGVLETLIGVDAATVLRHELRTASHGAIGNPHLVNTEARDSSNRWEPGFPPQSLDSIEVASDNDLHGYLQKILNGERDKLYRRLNVSAALRSKLTRLAGEISRGQIPPQIKIPKGMDEVLSRALLNRGLEQVAKELDRPVGFRHSVAGMNLPTSHGRWNYLDVLREEERVLASEDAETKQNVSFLAGFMKDSFGRGHGTYLPAESRLAIAALPKAYREMLVESAKAAQSSKKIRDRLLPVLYDPNPREVYSLFRSVRNSESGVPSDEILEKMHLDLNQHSHKPPVNIANLGKAGFGDRERLRAWVGSRVDALVSIKDRTSKEEEHLESLSVMADLLDTWGHVGGLTNKIAGGEFRLDPQFSEAARAEEVKAIQHASGLQQKALKRYIAEMGERKLGLPSVSRAMLVKLGPIHLELLSKLEEQAKNSVFSAHDGGKLQKLLNELLLVPDNNLIEAAFNTYFPAAFQKYVEDGLLPPLNNELAREKFLVTKAIREAAPAAGTSIANLSEAHRKRLMDYSTRQASVKAMGEVSEAWGKTLPEITPDKVATAWNLMLPLAASAGLAPQDLKNLADSIQADPEAVKALHSLVSAVSPHAVSGTEVGEQLKVLHQEVQKRVRSHRSEIEAQVLAEAANPGSQRKEQAIESGSPRWDANSAVGTVFREFQSKYGPLTELSEASESKVLGKGISAAEQCAFDSQVEKREPADYLKLRKECAAKGNAPIHPNTIDVKREIALAQLDHLLKVVPSIFSPEELARIRSELSEGKTDLLYTLLGEYLSKRSIDASFHNNFHINRLAKEINELQQALTKTKPDAQSAVRSSIDGKRKELEALKAFEGLSATSSKIWEAFGKVKEAAMGVAAERREQLARRLAMQAYNAFYRETVAAMEDEASRATYWKYGLDALAESARTLLRGEEELIDRLESTQVLSASSTPFSSGLGEARNTLAKSVVADLAGQGFLTDSETLWSKEFLNGVQTHVQRKSELKAKDLDPHLSRIAGAKIHFDGANLEVKDISESDFDRLSEVQVGYDFAFREPELRDSLRHVGRATRSGQDLFYDVLKMGPVQEINSFGAAEGYHLLTTPKDTLARIIEKPTQGSSENAEYRLEFTKKSKELHERALASYRSGLKAIEEQQRLYAMMGSAQYSVEMIRGNGLGNSLLKATGQDSFLMFDRWDEDGKQPHEMAAQALTSDLTSSIKELIRLGDVEINKVDGTAITARKMAGELLGSATELNMISASAAKEMERQIDRTFWRTMTEVGFGVATLGFGAPAFKTLQLGSKLLPQAATVSRLSQAAAAGEKLTYGQRALLAIHRGQTGAANLLRVEGALSKSVSLANQAKQAGEKISWGQRALVSTQKTFQGFAAGLELGALTEGGKAAWKGHVIRNEHKLLSQLKPCPGKSGYLCGPDGKPVRIPDYFDKDFDGKLDAYSFRDLLPTTDDVASMTTMGSTFAGAAQITPWLEKLPVFKAGPGMYAKQAVAVFASHMLQQNAKVGLDGLSEDYTGVSLIDGERADASKLLSPIFQANLAAQGARQAAAATPFDDMLLAYLPLSAGRSALAQSGYQLARFGAGYGSNVILDSTLLGIDWELTKYINANPEWAKIYNPQANINPLGGKFETFWDALYYDFLTGSLINARSSGDAMVSGGQQYRARKLLSGSWQPESPETRREAGTAGSPGALESAEASQSGGRGKPTVSAKETREVYEEVVAKHLDVNKKPGAQNLLNFVIRTEGFHAQRYQDFIDEKIKNPTWKNSNQNIAELNAEFRGRESERARTAFLLNPTDGFTFEGKLANGGMPDKVPDQLTDNPVQYQRFRSADFSVAAVSTPGPYKAVVGRVGDDFFKGLAKETEAKQLLMDAVVYHRKKAEVEAYRVSGRTGKSYERALAEQIRAMPTLQDLALQIKKTLRQPQGLETLIVDKTVANLYNRARNAMGKRLPEMVTWDSLQNRYADPAVDTAYQALPALDARSRASGSRNPPSPNSP